MRNTRGLSLLAGDGMSWFINVVTPPSSSAEIEHHQLLVKTLELREEKSQKLESLFEVTKVIWKEISKNCPLGGWRTPFYPHCSGGGGVGHPSPHLGDLQV